MFLNKKGKYVVIQAESFDYVYRDTKWMNIKELGNECFSPDPDSAKEIFVFNTEDEALDKMRKLWSELKTHKRSVKIEIGD